MNKKFLNDVKVLILFIPGVIFITFCLIASLMSADETAQYIISSVVWGGFDIFIIVSYFLLFFDIISVYDNRVVSRKIFKRSEIFYNKIKSIQEMDKLGLGGGGVEAVWEITDLTGNTIYIIRSKKRKNVIDFIKERS